MRLDLNFPTIKNNYLTPKKDNSFSQFPSIRFYWNMLCIVSRAAKLAKKGQYNDALWCESSFEVFNAIERVGTTVEIKNLELISEIAGPCVIVGNHMSTLETFILPYLICPFKKVTFVVKEALISYPIFKHIMISRNPIVVGRNNPKQDFATVMNEGTKRIQDGYSVIVFPQTTRMVEFDRNQFNSIGVKLARKTGAPIIPLALKTDCWGNGTLLKDFGKIDPKLTIHFEFGRPLSIEGSGKIQQEKIIQHIESCLARWKEFTTNSES